ncbi:MAG: SH3 domain-containing protein [Clostridiales bacterium]|jgi:hypothetical protein|nr:SH3 domain-containing protein [Clostridiales bacterium]
MATIAGTQTTTISRADLWREIQKARETDTSKNAQKFINSASAKKTNVPAQRADTMSFPELQEYFAQERAKWEQKLKEERDLREYLDEKLQVSISRYDALDARFRSEKERLNAELSSEKERAKREKKAASVKGTAVGACVTFLITVITFIASDVYKNGFFIPWSSENIMPPGSYANEESSVPESDPSAAYYDDTADFDSAIPTDPPEYYTVIAHGLNMRSEPSINADVLMVLNGGDYVEYLHDEVENASDNIVWFKVRDVNTGQTGWASGKYIELARGVGENEIDITTPAIQSKISSNICR